MPLAMRYVSAYGKVPTDSHCRQHYQHYHDSLKFFIMPKTIPAPPFSL